jgi:hypothetical protein
MLLRNVTFPFKFKAPELRWTLARIYIFLFLNTREGVATTHRQKQRWRGVKSLET